MNDGTSYVGWTLGFLVGVAAGAGAAVLLAPRSGRASRDRLGRQLRRRARTIRALKARLGRAAGAPRASTRPRPEADAIAGGDGLRP
jgi:YtxH-like protein